MVQDNHLSRKVRCFHWCIVFAVTGNIATMDIFQKYVSDIEALLVPREIFTRSFMVHFSGLDIDWHKVATMPGLRTSISTQLTGDNANIINVAGILQKQEKKACQLL